MSDEENECFFEIAEDDTIAIHVDDEFNNLSDNRPNSNISSKKAKKIDLESKKRKNELKENDSSSKKKTKKNVENLDNKSSSKSILSKEKIDKTTVSSSGKIDKKSNGIKKQTTITDSITKVNRKQKK